CSKAWDLGIDVVEIPVQTPDAIPSLRAAAAAARERGKDVGAGTIISPDQVAAVLHAGATFAVAPGFSPSVTSACLQHGLPHMPGVSTSTDITAALSEGLHWLKAFPAAQLGSGWITAQLAPFPHVSFVATGGLTGENAEEFLNAGARVVAVGRAIHDPRTLSAIAQVSR
ncbi:MAG: 2-dehydro-3-deoxyphosphogluconate aldolase, partial [Arthrobacter sp.]|nr:2-dehydro-3-deoxyphosphogluconate aldolase [Arthrobacter sp.]